ncbi:DNA/RNA nuclease SfsA [Marinimicrobium sp. C6131]|uniref:DNA/RNA nuclease SfsA n=1 Tax=Marinimicrobium sp. C6131 TaxID=3022676 RepID=UPI00223E75C6|nr:DNA/RNA nuclease SfsA [Marinimicrobium sp. C6131]UZJ46233.1 DNA/RNA nuclease SfsA [Marinimicrobium sp. C6131]
MLLRRYKRFLADVRLSDGTEMTIHCPNTGSMRHCVVPESPCWFSDSGNPKRKYRHTWEVATVPGGHLAGVNTGRANLLVEMALNAGRIAELTGYSMLRREVPYGQERSRIDFLLTEDGRPPCYVEVKSVTLMEQSGQGLFPDAVSERGRKHLRELMDIVRGGDRAVLLYCVQHTGIDWVEPADAIDPAYGQALREAAAAGVEIVAYRADIRPEEARIELTRPVPVRY